MQILTESIEEALDAKLRLWQQQDGTPLLPDVPAQALFAQWAEEDARMTDAEREAEDRLWQDIEQKLDSKIVAFCPFSTF